MKNVTKFVLLVVFVFGLFVSIAEYSKASVRVNGYYRSNGTYVNPYYKSSPDSTRWNNYSTKGNYNPYTGSKGYTSPYKSYTPSYKSYNTPSYKSYSTPSYKSYRY
ncbi:MAG: hypothetical protein EOM84_00490 [Sphingobacteriia bacterium]|jgi:hypothetical protein|nr:hypothetical protein [Sphingobacteriia bacterium]